MAIVHESDGTPTNTTFVSSFVLNRPSGVVSGDVLIAVFHRGARVAPTNTPTGWSLLGGEPTTGWNDASFGALYIYKKVAGGSEPSTYTWTWAAGATMFGSIARYSGVDNTTVEDVAAVTAIALNSTSAPSPSIGTNANGAMVCSAADPLAGSTTGTIATLTEWLDLGVSGPLMAADQVQDVSGGSGAKTWSLSNKTDTLTVTFALRPAAPVGIIRRSVGAPYNALTTTSFAVAKPAGVANGDVLVMVMEGSASSATAMGSLPSGWVEALPLITSGARLFAAYKVIANAAGEPADYTFTINQVTAVCARIICYTGVDNGTPLDATSTTGSFSNSTTANCPSINVATAMARLIGFGAATTGSAPYTSAVFGNVVTDVVSGGGDNAFDGDLTKAATGASGTMAYTGAAKAAGNTATIALRPASEAPPAAIPDVNMAPMKAAA